MAVVSVVELADAQRGGEFTGSEITSTRTWLVEVDSPTDTEYSIIAATGTTPDVLPAYLEQHPGNANATLRKLSITNYNPYRGWKAVGTYSTAPLTQSEKEKKEPNPLNRPAKITVRTRSEMVAQFYDRNGKPLVNTACDFFDPPPEGRRRIRVFHVSKDLANPPVWLLDYLNATNSDAFTIDGVSVAVGRARCGDVAISDRKEENGVSFRTVTFEVEVFDAPPSATYVNSDGSGAAPLGTSRIQLNQGLRERSTIAPDSPLRAILDKDGSPVTQPIALNAAGQKLTNPTPDNVLYVVYNELVARAFSALPLT